MASEASCGPYSTWTGSSKRRMDTRTPLRRWVAYHPPRLTGSHNEEASTGRRVRARTVAETVLLLSRYCPCAPPPRRFKPLPPGAAAARDACRTLRRNYFTLRVPLLYTFPSHGVCFFSCWWAVVGPSVSPPSHGEESRRGLKMRKSWGVQGPLEKNDWIVKVNAQDASVVICADHIQKRFLRRRKILPLHPDEEHLRQPPHTGTVFLYTYNFPVTVDFKLEKRFFISIGLSWYKNKIK